MKTTTDHVCVPWVDCGHGEPFPPATQRARDDRHDDRNLCYRCNGGGITYYGHTCSCSGGYRA